MSQGWKTDIFKQKGLVEIYQQSRGILPRSKSNVFVFWVSVAAFVGLWFWGVFDWFDKYTVADSISFLRAISAQGLSLSIGVLGFLIAGFAIFASITKVDLFIALANIKYGDTGINRLQFVFFNFLNVFTVYLGLLAFSVALVLGLSDSSPLVMAINSANPVCKVVVVATVFAVSALGLCWIISAILKLKSFIWNLYQTVLVAITTEAEIKERQRKENDASGSA